MLHISGLNPLLTLNLLCLRSGRENKYRDSKIITNSNRDGKNRSRCFPSIIIKRYVKILDISFIIHLYLHFMKLFNFHNPFPFYNGQRCRVLIGLMF